MDNKFEIKRIYFLLKGHFLSIENSSVLITQKVANEVNKLIHSLEELIQEDLSSYIITEEDQCDFELYVKETILWQVVPVLTLLENIYLNNSEYEIAKVGYLYHSIEDKELHDRCGDILLGEKAFDRAINQATQILEDRIKKKSKLTKSHLIGFNLVSKAIHAKKEQTILKFSEDDTIQEGYSNLFKGIISIYRNPTHHSFQFQCSREYALKFCAYIDELLRLIEKSEYIERQ